MATGSETCLLHRDRPAASAIGGCSYCASCRQEIAAVAGRSAHTVTPRDCFAAALPGGGWRALAGSGAAHWVAHELGIRSASAQSGCAAGFAVRRAELLLGRREIVRELPLPRDLWVDLYDEGCGLVVAAGRSASNEVLISIRGLVDARGLTGALDFYRDLHGRGRFFR